MADGKIKTVDAVYPKSYGLGIRHVQMVCMCFAIMSLFIARSSLGVAILAMTDTRRRNDTNVEIFEWDKKTQGLILSSFFWGYMMMQVPAGLLANRFGGKLILLVALLANGAICLLMPILANLGWWMVCFLRMGMGLTQACTFPASHTLLGRWLPANERTSLSGIVYAGSQIGTIIALPVSGVLADTAAGWKVIFYSISGLMFFTAIIWYCFSASSPEEHSMISEEEKYYIEMELNGGGSRISRPVPWRDILCTRSLWAILVTHTGCTLSFILFFNDMPTYLEKALGMSLKNSAMLSAFPYIGMWMGTLMASTLCEKIYNRGLLSLWTCRRLFNSIALFGVSAALVVLSFLGPEHINIAIVTLIVGLSLSGSTSAGFMVNHLDLSPQFAGVMLSLTNLAASIASIIMPVCTSLILRNDSTAVDRWHIVFLIIGGITVGSNIVYLIFGSADRQPWDRADYHDRRRADPEEMKPALTPLVASVEKNGQRKD